MTTATKPRALGEPPARAPRPASVRIRRASIVARGEPMLWVTGGALVACIVMIALFLAWVASAGLATFWPRPLVQLELDNGTTLLGEVRRHESWAAHETGEQGTPDPATRTLLRSGNFELTGSHYVWVEDARVVERTEPPWALTVEREEWGRFHGTPSGFAELFELEEPAADGETVAESRARARSLSDRFAGTLHAVAGVAVRWVVGRVHGDAPVRVLLEEGDLREGERPSAVALFWPGSEPAWGRVLLAQERVEELRAHRARIAQDVIGEIDEKLDDARLQLRQAELDHAPPPAWVTAHGDLLAAREGGDADIIAEAEAALAALEEQGTKPSAEFLHITAEVERDIARQTAAFAAPMARIEEVDRQLDRDHLVFPTSEGAMLLPVSHVVRAYPANRLTMRQKVALYFDRWWEFLSEDPRESNTAGGIFPALFGTVLMTLLMTFAVVPFGVIAALYIREYAKSGPVISAVRIAINNLAGVPSIVFGVFGLGFFCYVIGSSIDQTFFAAKLPAPTFGQGGLLWGALTLALLTLPVVIVATEEALAAVPNSMRQGSYACGASKWQTIRRIVLPRALPGILTGAILAMARGAGEVAPLMLVGAANMAPDLPIDWTPPFGVNRKFMHLGFHIYDLAFQSQDSEGAKPMVFTTTLLLITLITLLNVVAIVLRSRLRRRFAGGQF